MSRDDPEVILSSAASFTCLEAPSIKTSQRTGEVIFNFVDPGTYYARAFADRNHNGIWDAGSVVDSIQPEDVFYYPKKLTASVYPVSAVRLGFGVTSF